MLSAADSLIDQLRTTGVLVGVSKQGRAFREAKEEFSKNAREWLFWVVVSGAALLGVVIYFSCASGPPEPKLSWSTAANLAYFASHALGLSILSFALIVCLRNYRACKHNEIMNAHRERALSTFEEFRDAAEGKASDIVLLQASSAIFGVQASGFVDGEGGGATHLQELIASMGMKKD
jgi:hypothetical protein